MGGIGGAILLAIAIWLFFRKRRKDDFDGDFDPDRVVGGRRVGGMDLVGGEAGAVEPYNYAPPGAGGQQMSQTGSSAFGAGAAGLGAGMAAGARRPPPSSAPGPGSGGASAPSAYSGGHSAASQSHYAPSTSDPGYDYNAYAAYSDPQSGSVSGHGNDSTSPRSSAFPGGFNPGYVPEGAYRDGPSPGPSLPGTGTGSSSAGMTIPSSKEMEGRGLRVANAPGGEGGGVVQHEDAGRVPVHGVEEEIEPSEIPPSYDSIRRE